MDINPPMQCCLHKVGGIALNAPPVARLGDIQFNQCLCQTNGGTLAGVKVILKRNSVEAWDEQMASTSHQARGGSHPGGGASGVAL
jgi:hypothetical protein